MYRTYYNFNAMPFEISPDPKFLWLGKKYGEALAAMRYGILANKGFISLTGDVGTGKTTIVNALANSLGDNIIFAKIPDPSLKTLDFFNFTANAFEMNKRFSTKGDFLNDLEAFLNNAYTKGKKVTLIIEEAQRLNQGLLEEIRLLSNIEKPNKKLINILFVGQNEFKDILKTNKALRHRITVSCRIEPLTEIETEKYILHRLKIAGSKSRIFSPGAVQEVFSFSEGNPRLINIICDLALLSGYVQETKIIESEIIRECTANVLIPNQKSAGVIKDPKVLAKTLQETRIRGLATLRDVDPEVAEKVRTKPSRRKAVYMAAIALLIFTCVLGYLYYFEGYNTSIGNLKPFLEQTLSRFAGDKSETSPQKLPLVKNSNSGSEITKSSDNRDQKQALIPQADEITFRQRDISQSQTQLLDLKTQKASADSQIERLVSRNDELIAEPKDLERTKERVLALENVVKKRDQMLSQLEQKLKQLENALDQEKNSNNQIRTDLSSKTARVIDLQQQLEASRSNHNKLEDEVEKSKEEIVHLQEQQSDLKTKQASTSSSRVLRKVRKKLPSESDIPKKESEFPNPAAIIDWVIKKKSE